MASMQEEAAVPAIRFKRRKTTHIKRVKADEDAAVRPNSSTPDVASPTDAPAPPTAAHEDDPAPSLKEILRNRKRPRDRVKEAARKPELAKTELVPFDAPQQQNAYTSRFVAQTGQVVDRDDKQMTTFVEARLAEQNFRKYGWPIPSHLKATVAEIAPDLQPTASSTSQVQTGSATIRPADIEHSIRLAAGMGKIQEVEPGPDPTHRTDHKWRRLENGEFEQVSTGKVRLGRDGKPRRPPKRRNSEDVKRDQMVEAVLSEAKLDYFDAPAPNPHAANGGNNDEALLERFQAEYYESIEEARQQQRKPAAPVKGAPEVIKGPKLGGSKSARAKMHKLQQEELAKKKR